MRNYILIAFLLASTLGISQNIKGKITSKNGEAIPFASIYIKNTKLGTTSTEDGTYQLNYRLEGRYMLIVSSIGFQTKKSSVVLHGGNLMKNIILEDDNTLDEIVVSGTLRPVSKTASPVPVEVYSKTFFKKNPTPSVFESLQNVNGIRPQLNCNVCNTGDIHINGLEGPYTFVLSMVCQLLVAYLQYTV